MQNFSHFTIVRTLQYVFCVYSLQANDANLHCYSPVTFPILHDTQHSSLRATET